MVGLVPISFFTADCADIYLVLKDFHFHTVIWYYCILHLEYIIPFDELV